MRLRLNSGGCGRNSDKSEFCGSWKMYWPDGTPLPHDECPMALALKEKRPIRGMEAIAERPDGTRVRFIPYPSPLFNASGAFIGAVNTLVDITHRHEADSRIRESEARYRTLAAIVEFSEDAVLTKDLNGVITSWNRGRPSGCSATRLKRRSASRLPSSIPAERHDEEPAILDRIRRGERIDHYETVRQRKDGNHHRHFADHLAGQGSGRQDHRRIQDRPRHHRPQAGRGTAATAAPGNGPSRQESVCPRQRRGGPLRPFGDDAGGTVVGSERPIGGAGAGARLDAPAVAGGSGNGRQSTTLHALIDTILSPHEGRTDDGRARLTVSGPDIPIAASTVTSFALLLHEFATNAAKYGALSTAQAPSPLIARRTIAVHLDVAGAGWTAGRTSDRWRRDLAPSRSARRSRTGWAARFHATGNRKA